MVHINLAKQNRRTFGNQAEDYVAQELITQSFTIRERNYQKRYGEIDIIAHKADTLIFVEVKVRMHDYVSMHEIITLPKQRKIGLVAQEYISRNNIDDKICRFDVALVHIDDTGSFGMTYIPDAFRVDS